MAYSHWYGLVIDPEFDTMFNGPIDSSFCEEPYQGNFAKGDDVHIRKAVVNNPPLGKNSPWPVARRLQWKT